MSPILERITSFCRAQFENVELPPIAFRGESIYKNFSFPDGTGLETIVAELKESALGQFWKLIASSSEKHKHTCDVQFKKLTCQHAPRCVATCVDTCDRVTV